jgi:N-acetylmuramoyl-L-alanine amidase
MRVVGRGSSGRSVRDIQARLHALGFRTEPDPPGSYEGGTEGAVRELQQRRHLLVDGLVGPDTWQEMVEAGHALGDRTLYLRYPAVRGDDVRQLQATLNLLGFDAGREDGILGARTDSAIREFQRNVGVPEDGIVGASTVETFAKLRPGTGGPGFAAVRERASMRDLSPSHLRGAVIAVEAGHGPTDPGAVGPTGLREAEASAWIAEALARELAGRGASPLLLRSGDEDPDVSDRARRANDADATLLVAIHLNSQHEQGGEGATVIYCGRQDWSSPLGHRLAEAILEQLTGLGLTDGRTHPRWLPLLRETRMPAVHVEPCFITNPEEERLLREESFRTRVARAIAAGIERYFEGPVLAPAHGAAGVPGSTGVTGSTSPLGSEPVRAGASRSPSTGGSAPAA